MPRPRRPFTFWVMTILFVFFSLFGVLVIASARDASGRLLGAAILLVFGFGGVGYLSGPALTRRGPATVRRDHVDVAAGSEPAFVFPSPRGKRRATVLGLGGLAIGTALMLALTGGGPFLIAGAAFLCVIFLWTLFGLRRPQLLALTPTCVLAVMPTGTVEIPWEAGIDAELYPMPTGQSSVDMIGIKAASPASAVWRRGGALGRLNHGLSQYLVSMAADAFAGEGEDVVAAIRHYATQPDARRRIGAEDEHDRVLRELGEPAPPAAVAGL